MKELEREYKALANGKRLAILKYLNKANRASVGDIAKEIKLTLKATSKHLGVLSSVEAVEKTKQSLLVLYYLSEKPRATVSHFLKLIS